MAHGAGVGRLVRDLAVNSDHADKVVASGVAAKGHDTGHAVVEAGAASDGGREGIRVARGIRDAWSRKEKNTKKVATNAFCEQSARHAALAHRCR